MKTVFAISLLVMLSIFQGSTLFADDGGETCTVSVAKGTLSNKVEPVTNMAAINAFIAQLQKSRARIEKLGGVEIILLERIPAFQHTLTGTGERALFLPAREEPVLDYGVATKDSTKPYRDSWLPYIAESANPWVKKIVDFAQNVHLNVSFTWTLETWSSKDHHDRLKKTWAPGDANWSQWQAEDGQTVEESEVLKVENQGDDWRQSLTLILRPSS